MTKKQRTTKIFLHISTMKTFSNFQKYLCSLHQNDSGPETNYVSFHANNLEKRLENGVQAFCIISQLLECRVPLYIIQLKTTVVQSQTTILLFNWTEFLTPSDVCSSGRQRILFKTNIVIYKNIHRDSVYILKYIPNIWNWQG